MARTWNIFNRALLLGVLLLAASCADTRDPVGFGRPQMVDLPGFQAVRAPVHGEITVSAEIDQKGGTLTAPAAANGGPLGFGYLLYVPAGTVKKPTTFTMRVVAGDQYTVDLTAIQTDRKGNVTNVGNQLAKDPVLVISFRDSPSPVLNPNSMVIVYEPDDHSAPVRQPTFVDGQNSIIFGVLSHFSRYTAAWN